MLSNSGRPWLAVVLIAASLAAAPAYAVRPAAQAGTSVPAQQPAANPDVRIVAEFQERVKEYLALRGKVESALPQLPAHATPEQIQERQHALERLIRQARSGARQGDLLTQPVRAFIRRQIARVFAGIDGSKVKATLMDENVRGVKLLINSRYPDDLPLTTVPPQLLLSLPRLPRELEFRFVGDRLALLDVRSRLVLDFMNNALP